MTEDEDLKLREAIREALAYGKWEQDIGFLTPIPGSTSNQADAIPTFAVLVDADDMANVTIPLEWEHLPYLRETLQSITTHELRAHLGLSSSPKIHQQH